MVSWETSCCDSIYNDNRIIIEIDKYTSTDVDVEPRDV